MGAALREFYTHIDGNCDALPFSKSKELHDKAKTGDNQSRNILVMSIVRQAVRMTLTKWSGKTGLSDEDLIGEATLLACHAVDTWEPDKSQLSTHTHWVVTHGMVNAVADRGHKGIFVPRSAIKITKRKYVLPQFNVKDSRQAKQLLIFIRAKEALQINPIYSSEDRIFLSSENVVDDRPCLADIDKEAECLTPERRDIIQRYFGLGKYRNRECFTKISQDLNLKLSSVKHCIREFLLRFQKRVCVLCSKSYVSQELEQTMCSDECRKVHADSLRVYFDCKQCGKKTLRGGHHYKYCSKECSQTAYKINYSLRNKTRVKVTLQYECKRCQKPFSTDNPKKKFCNKKCWNLYVKETSQETINQTCLGCGKDFEIKEGRKRRFCNKSCQAKRKLLCPICKNESYCQKVAKYCSYKCKGIAMKQAHKIKKALAKSSQVLDNSDSLRELCSTHVTPGKESA
jgi:hypothetical protein